VGDRFIGMEDDVGNETGEADGLAYAEETWKDVKDEERMLS